MLKNVVANWMEIIFSTISVFILFPYLTKTMGESQYGVWLLLAAMTGYFNMFQLGIPISNVRYISRYYAKKDLTKVNEVINTSLGMFLSMSVIVLIAGAVILLMMDTIFEIPSEFVKYARLAIIITSVNIALNFVFEVFEGVMHAFQNFVVLNSIKVSLIVLRVIATLLFVTYEYGLIELALIIMSISFLQGIILFIYIKRKYNFIKFSVRLFNRPMLKKIFNYSVYALVFQMSSRLAFQTDPMVIGAVISTSAIVYFSVGNNFLIYLMEFVRGISRALVPKSSELDARERREDIKDIYINYSKITYYIVLLAGLILIMLGKDFIGIWMGSDYREPSGNVLIVLTISYIFFLVQRGVSHPILMGTSKLKFPTYLMLATALVNLILSIILARKYGIIGVAWGTAIPNVINAIIMIWFTTRYLKVDIFNYIFKTILYPSLASIFVVIPVILIKQYFAVDSYFKFFVICITISLIYVGGVVMILVDKKTKKDIFSLIKR